MSLVTTFHFSDPWNCSVWVQVCDLPCHICDSFISSPCNNGLSSSHSWPWWRLANASTGSWHSTSLVWTEQPIAGIMIHFYHIEQWDHWLSPLFLEILKLTNRLTNILTIFFFVFFNLPDIIQINSITLFL